MYQYCLYFALTKKKIIIIIIQNGMSCKLLNKRIDKNTQKSLTHGIINFNQYFLVHYPCSFGFLLLLTIISKCSSQGIQRQCVWKSCGVRPSSNSRGWDKGTQKWKFRRGREGYIPWHSLWCWCSLLTDIVVQVLLSLLRATLPLSGTMTALKKAWLSTTWSWSSSWTLT